MDKKNMWWYPISTAPKDERVLVTCWRPTPTTGLKFAIARVENGRAFTECGEYMYPEYWTSLPEIADVIPGRETV